MRSRDKAVHAQTYLWRYLLDYLASNLIAYAVIVIYIAYVSGYTPEEVGLAFANSRLPMAGLVTVMCTVLYRILLPLKRAILAVDRGEPVPEALSRRVVGLFKHYRAYVLAIDLVAYPSAILLSILKTYRAEGLVYPRQWAILANGTLVVFAIAIFQQTLFNLRSTPVKERLKLHSFAGVKSGSLAASIAGTVFFFMLSYAATAYNNDVRTTRLFRDHEVAALARLDAAATAEEVQSLRVSLAVEAAAFADGQNRVSLVYSAVMLVVCMLGISLFAREVRSHVAVSRRKLAEITSEGCDLSQKVVITTFNDIGLLGQDVNTLIDRNRALFTNIAEASRSVGEASASLADLASGLVEDSGRMREESAGVSGEAGEMSGKMQELSVSAGELDSSIAGVSGAAVKLDGSIAHIAGKAREASSVAAEMARGTRSRGEEVARLGSLSEEIGVLIELIGGIGRKTTILSLNAAVEAARAGKAGRGFAVVAAEVKQLAQQVNEAAEKIRERIHTIRDTATEAVSGMKALSTSADNVDGIVSSIAASVQDQSRATGDISRHIGSAAEDVREMTAHIGVNTETITSVAASAQTLNDTSQAVSFAGERIGESSHSLADVAAGLEAEVRKFRL